MNPTPEQVPEGHPYDMAGERAGREMWTFQAEWRKRHGLTRIQYLWVVNRMLAEELRIASQEDMAAFDKANEAYGNGPEERKS